MKNSADLILRSLRKIYPIKYKLFGQLDKNYTDRIQQDDSDTIYKNILSDKSLMISRFGATELNCLINYLDQKKSGKYINYITGKSNYYKWENVTLESMCNLSGFFPPSYELLERFCELILEDCKLIDILGSWLKYETILESELNSAIKMGFLNLEPYNHEHPWSKALEGLTVLVIHPFTESIHAQYEKRHFLFSDKRVLPDFDLKTIKAVQSIARTRTDYKNWFDALESMKEKITATNFDVAIIGCGAYGMPLAAHVKRLGKKSIHLGGATQLLFGISGKRWEGDGYGYKKLMNSYWTKPLQKEIPQNYQKVEDGCYW